MRLIDADEIIKNRVENDPIKLAVDCAPTVEVEPRLPQEPIQCAAMLIGKSIEYETSTIQRAFGAGEKAKVTYYSVDELRQIAEFLLLYCKFQKDGENESMA